MHETSTEHRVSDFSRNLGLLSRAQQESLARSTVAVCGVGGMGGIAAEALARIGIGEIIIADSDEFEATDINRQLHCTHATMGCQKTSVIAERLKDIHPRLRVNAFGKVARGNVANIVDRADIVINGMDSVRSSIELERYARIRRKTIVDAWLTPYASVFVMSPQAPHWEEFLKFPTLGKHTEDITDTDIEACLRCEIEFTFQQFRPYEIVSKELVDEVVAGTRPRPSLLPVVWFSGILMANEAMKVLTGQGRIATHWGVFYDQYEHELIYFDGLGRPDV